MYLEWQLPRGSGGMAAQYVSSILKKELQAWYVRYKLPYRLKTIKYTIRLTFDDDVHYTAFAATWQPKNQQYKDWLRYRVIDNLNNRQDTRNQV